jgi:hypothetical protein
MSAVVAMPTLASAATSTAATTDTSAGSFAPPTNASFTGAANLQLNNLFTTCIDPSQSFSSLESIFTKGQACQGVQGASCTGPETAPDSSDFTCDNFKTTSGFDNAKYKADEATIQAVLCTEDCKTNEEKKLQTELSCLRNQANLLSQQVTSLGNAFQTNIQRFQKDVASLQQTITDRQAQSTDALSKLGGDKNSGKAGLRDLKALTVSLIGELPTDVLKVQNEQVKAKNDTAALQEQVESRTAALASDCFNKQVQPNFTCVPNGPPVSAHDYVICRYQQNQVLGVGGVIEQDANTASKAASNAQGLGALLDTITNSAPTNASVPTNQQQAIQQDQNPISVYTVADVESQFGTQLQSFNGKGLDIHAFVISYLGSCYAKATAVVSQEQQRASSLLGIAAASIQTEERQTSQEVNDILNKGALQYDDDLQGLTGQQLPLNISACENATPDNQLNCINDLRSNLEGLLYGNTANSTVSMSLPGQDPNNTITFQCQGINGCINSLENVNRNLGLEINKVTAFEKQYVQQANQSTQTYVKSIAQSLSPQSQALTTRLQTLNQALSSLGVKQGIDIKPVENTQLEYDSPPPDGDGLVKNPTNILGLVGSQLNPPLLDVTGDNFSTALSGLADETNTISDNTSKAQAAMNSLKSLVKTCGAQFVQAAETDLQTQATTLGGLNCGAIDTNCPSDVRTQQLTSEIDDIAAKYGSAPGLDPSILSSLDTGINGACAKGTAGNQTTTGGSQCISASSALDQKITALRKAAANAATSPDDDAGAADK